MVTSEQAFDLVDRAFRELSDELLPVSVLDLQEASQVIRLEQHQSYEAPIELLVALDLVLELAALVPVELLLVHGECETLHQCSEIVG